VGGDWGGYYGDLWPSVYYQDPTVAVVSADPIVYDPSLDANCMQKVAEMCALQNPGNADGTKMCIVGAQNLCLKTE
jgi:hypothetical protein